MYFDIEYVKTLDATLINQINSYHKVQYDKNIRYIILNEEKVVIPDLPNYEWKLNREKFIKGLENNKTFIN
jgi:hypothetical protein